ncbi:MAG: hypothetical protein C0463_08800 [Idiomarina sp.]|nr:hypothetical protein [Idiomarina sp.]
MQGRVVHTIFYLAVIGWLSLSFTALVSSAQAHTPAQQTNSDAEVIHVAAYEFPPYYSSHLPEHLLGGLLDYLNAQQQEYVFNVIEIRSTARYQQVSEEGCCSLIFFQAPEWGWQQNSQMIRGPRLSRGADLYVALKPPSEVIANDPLIGGLRGYHYQFTDFQHDSELLEYEHRMYLADNHFTLVNMLQRERLDLVMVSEEFLGMLAALQPQKIDLTELQTEVDLNYHTYLLAHQSKQALLDWLEEQLTTMHQSGELSALFERFGVGEHLDYAPRQSNHD